MKFLKPNSAADTTTFHRQEALRCVPVVNRSVHISQTSSGEILLEYQIHIKPFLQAIFKRFQKEQSVPTKKLQLDKMGSGVWQQIDGEKNVQNIITEFAQTYSITLQEAEQSVTAFLVELGKRGIIAMK